MQDLETTAPAATSPLPFAPLTDTGLALAIETAAMQVTWAVNAHRATEPAVISQAQLVVDMCKARRCRMIAVLAAWLYENSPQRYVVGAA